MRFAIALAELEQRWHNLRVESRPLSEREAMIWRSISMTPTSLLTERIPRGTAHGIPRLVLAAFLKLLTSNAWDVSPSAVKRVQMEVWCKDLASEHLQAKGIRTDEAGLQSMAGAVAYALQAASIELERLAIRTI